MVLGFVRNKPNAPGSGTIRDSKQRRGDLILVALAMSFITALVVSNVIAVKLVLVSQYILKVNISVVGTPFVYALMGLTREYEQVGRRRYASFPTMPTASEAD